MTNILPLCVCGHMKSSHSSRQENKVIKQHNGKCKLYSCDCKKYTPRKNKDGNRK